MQKGAIIDNSTPNGLQRGTLAYMAIEMYDSEAVITYAVDVYSFGVILNEIVTGEAPSKRRGLSNPRFAPLCTACTANLYRTE